MNIQVVTVKLQIQQNEILSNNKICFLFLHSPIELYLEMKLISGFTVLSQFVEVQLQFEFEFENPCDSSFSINQKKKNQIFF